MDRLFRIIEITGELAKEISSGPKEDHFHDFEELIVITEGSLTHYIDFGVETAAAPFICYVPMGKMHRLEPGSDLRGWVINYKPEFIPDSKLNFYSNFFTFTNIPLTSGKCLNRFAELCRIITAEYSLDPIDYTTIRHLVNGLISMFDAEKNRSIPLDPDLKSSQADSFNNFLAILEEYFRNDHGVSFYASRMNMSERNLNLICRNNFRMSVSEIIETRKLIEAKRMLLYSGLSVSEIGYALGYNEKSYFTRVFHARMGITPSRYREMTKSILS